MKKVTKRLLISVMVLVAAVSLAVTSTLAWFTMDDAATVEGFEVNVTTQDGLYISLVAAGSVDGSQNDGSTATTGQAGTFKSYVTGDEVAAAIALYNSGAFNGKVLTHATTEDGQTFTTPAGIVEVNPDLNETTHITFRLFFYSTTPYEVSLKLNDEPDLTGDTATSTVTSQRGANALPYTKAWMGNSLELELGTDVQADAANAVRLAFNNGTDTNVWEPNAEEGWAGTGAALEYYNFTTKTDLVAGTPMADTVTAGQTLLTLTGDDATGYNGYLDITIWLEGWDDDAFNSILSDVITTSLVFQGTVVA